MTALDAKNRPDYRLPAYTAMEKPWTICEDVKVGTDRMREKSGEYLPKFESEDELDYQARLKMSFANNHYTQALEDHVGLVFAKPWTLSSDVPNSLAELLENVDGEGTHFDVFMQNAFTLGLDHGHALILTDYPTVPEGMNLAEARAQQLRPYLALYSGKSAINWRTDSIGGVLVLTQITLHERVCVPDGEFGEVEVDQFRIFKQAVIRNRFGIAIGLGDVTFQVQQKQREGNSETFTTITEGTLRDPKGKPLPRIPIRVHYGRRTGFLTSVPHLYELAQTNLQETQLESDYAAVMHKCNVPTPVFVGRAKPKPGQTITMGRGIDIPAGGNAFFLEPEGRAIAATRNRLMDLRTQIQRQGGFVRDSIKTMTATEAALVERQRNARLIRAARSLKDALEGALMDMALYMPELNGKSGSIEVSMEFGSTFDPEFTRLCLDAYEKGALPLDATLYVLKYGKLPDEFEPDEVAMRMLVESSKSRPMVEDEMLDDEDTADAEDDTEDDTGDTEGMADDGDAEGTPGGQRETDDTEDA